MREYRFRVWNPSDETMTYNVGLRRISEYADETLIKMQMTGLKDRNGTNIYEGDFLEWSYVNPMSGDKVTKLYEVAFDKGNFYARLVGLHPYGTTMLYFANQQSEVIGNEFEIPELLMQE